MLPYLFYDTEIPYSFLRNNRPFRNAGDLFVSSCPSVINVLRLCGAEERIVKGECSDFERFVAIGYSMPYLTGHPVNNGITTILREVFGIYEELTPYNCEEMWEIINSTIEDNELTPTSILSALNVESVSCRVDPFEASENGKYDVDLYTISDLSNISRVISSKSNSATTLDDFITAVSDLSSRSALRFCVDKHYFYVRNSKKLELEQIYSKVRVNEQVTEIELNSLKTAVIVEVLKKSKNEDKPVIVELRGNTDELDKLYSYLELNATQPNITVIITDDPAALEDFTVKHTLRSPIGLPSIIIVGNDTSLLSNTFPIGFSVQYQGKITDIVSLTATISSGEHLSIAFGDDIAENMMYGNIKNIFHI